MPKKILLFLFLLFTIHSFSQNGRKNILGKIVSDSIAIKNVHIFNMTSRKGTISHAYGEFQIPVKKNDTILISDVQYQVRQFIIDETHLRNVQLLISLKLNINELNEVEIKEHDLTGNLNNDATNVKDGNKMNTVLLAPNAWKIDKDVLDDIDALNREKAESARRLTDPTVLPDNIITYLMNLSAKTILSQASKIGQKKRHKNREQEIYAEKAISAPNKIRTELGDSFFVSTLNIPPQNIDDFINYCTSKGVVEKYLEGSKIEAIDILIKHSKTYLKEIKE